MGEGMPPDISLTGTAEDLVQVTGIHSDSRITTDITSITTAIDAAAYLDLCLCRHHGKEHYQTDYGISISQSSILLIHL